MPTTEQQARAELTGPGGPFEIRTESVLGTTMRTYAGGPRSMRDILLASRAFGDRDFIVWYDERYTFAEHFSRVAVLAVALRDDYGVGPGDRVAIGMRNYPEFLVAFWATQALGAVAVPLNAWWTGAELAYGLADSGSCVLFADGERLDRLDGHFTALPALRSVISVRTDAVGTGSVGTVSVDRLEDLVGRFDGTPALPDAPIDIDAPATIMYTSGTTGRPKGAIGTQRNHCTNLMNTILSGAVAAATAGPDAPAPPPTPATLQVFPFFHVGGLSGLYITTYTGTKIVLMYKWETEEAWDLVEREHATSASMVPMLLRQFLEAGARSGRDGSGLVGLASGGSSVPPDLIRRIEDQYASKVSPANGYGLTETTSAIVSNSGANYFTHPDSVGRPGPTADVRVVGADGADVAEGSIGEVWFRGPNVVDGYWNRPEATAEAFTDGWFHTGDVGYLDADGFLYIVDRIKDVVIRGGENVYCAEVEAVLFEHPAVLDVAVVGIPSDRYGEEVGAVVQLRDGVDVSAGELQEHAAATLAAFKVPSVVILRRDPLPRNGTGKVLKRELRQEVGGAGAA